jgi:hypothetical protein
MRTQDTCGNSCRLALLAQKLFVVSSEGVNVVSGATVHTDNGRAIHLPPTLIARHMPTHGNIRVETLLSTKQDTVVHFSKGGDIAVHNNAVSFCPRQWTLLSSLTFHKDIFVRACQDAVASIPCE